MTTSAHTVIKSIYEGINRRDIPAAMQLTVCLLWHVELDGIPFPNGRGVSFYRLSDTISI